MEEIYFPSPKTRETLIDENDWGFYILNHARQGMAARNFYKLYLYAKDLPMLYGAPKQIHEKITEIILETL